MYSEGLINDGHLAWALLVGVTIFREIKTFVFVRISFDQSIYLKFRFLNIDRVFFLIHPK